jgi:molybdopterin-guanine dinucleotide biosynthesis protein MobB
LNIRCPTPLLGFCAYSGTGKTTLLARLIPLLKADGLRLALVKHAHHSFDIDQPGKDSYELRKAGADQVLIASRRRLAIVKECADPTIEPQLSDILPWVDPDDLDLILVEGFKHAPIPKIEIYRPALGYPQIHASDPHVVAVASDAPFRMTRDLPMLDLNRPPQVLGFVLDWLQVGRTIAAAG